MQVVVFGIVGALLVAATIFAASLFGAAFGGLAGWIVGLTGLGDWILHVLGSFGAKGFTMAEFGSLLGFMSGFFRASLKAKE